MTFRDPVVDDTVLVRPAIQSPDYVPGVSGWSVNAAGDAEFNDAAVRGELVTAAPDGSRVEITADPVAAVTLYPASLGSTGPAGLRTGTDPAAAASSGLVLEGPAHADGQPVVFLGRGNLLGVYAAIRGVARLIVDAATAVAVNAPAVSLTGDLAVSGDIRISGRQIGRGLWASVSSAVSSADVTTHTAVLTTPTATYRAGRAYEVRMFGGVATSAAGVAGDFRFWKAGGAGFLGEFGKFSAPAVGTAFQATGSGLLFQVPDGAADVVCQLQLTLTPVLGAAGSTARHAAVGGPRRFTVWDVGAAVDFPDAAVLS